MRDPGQRPPFIACLHHELRQTYGQLLWRTHNSPRPDTELLSKIDPRRRQLYINLREAVFVHIPGHNIDVTRSHRRVRGRNRAYRGTRRSSWLRQKDRRQLFTRSLSRRESATAHGIPKPWLEHPSAGPGGGPPPRSQAQSACINTRQRFACEGVIPRSGLTDGDSISFCDRHTPRLADPRL